MLSTISSDGFINLYLLTSLPPSPAPLAPASETSSLPVILPVTSYDTKGTRLTCMSMCIVTEPGMGSEAGSEFGGVQEVLSEDDDEDEDEEAWGGVGGDSDEESEGEEGSDGFEENPGYANEDEMEEEDEDEGEYE
jgi:protein MAK11